MVKVFLLFFISFNFMLSNDIQNISIHNFAKLISTTYNVDILIDEEVNKNITLFVGNKYRKKKELFEVFEKSLSKLDYDLKKSDFGFYFITKKIVSPVSLKYRSLNLLYFNFDSIVSIMDLFTNVKFKIVKNQNILLIYSGYEDYLNVKYLLSKVDKSVKFANLKITIFELNENEINNKGIDFYTALQGAGDFGYYFDILTTPTLNLQNAVIGRSGSFYGSLNWLASQGVAKINHSIIVNLRNGENYSLRDIKNIGFLNTVTKVTGTEKSDVQNYSYKDVGFKLDVVPFINNDFLLVDIDLSSEDILEAGDKPVTSIKSIKTKSKIKSGEIVLISGIKKVTQNTYERGITWLKDLWGIGWLFKSSFTSIDKKTVFITIEYLKNNITPLNDFSFYLEPESINFDKNISTDDNETTDLKAGARGVDAEARSMSASERSEALLAIYNRVSDKGNFCVRGRIESLKTRFFQAEGTDSFAMLSEKMSKQAISAVAVV